MSGQDKITLSSEKWVNDGFTIAHEEGIPWFIKGMIPGETGICSVTRKTRKFAHATAIKITNPSPDRIEPDCPVFNECGGCSYRHVSYQYELELKKNLLRDNLSYALINSESSAIDNIDIVSHDELNYRNNVQIKAANGKIGFYKTNTNEIVPLPPEGCRNLANELNEYILSSRKGFELSAKKEIRLRLTDQGIVEYSDAESKLELLGNKYSVPGNGFLQINRYLTEIWLKMIQDNSPVTGHIAEFFSGSGIISVALKDHCEYLTGFEIDKNAVRYANKNAKANGVKNFNFYPVNLYEQKLKIPKSSYWIFNPPRSGLNKLITDQVLQHQPEQILYSSCNYITLGRDLKELSDKYSVTKIVMLDFFPRTPHFETVAVLVKK